MLFRSIEQNIQIEVHKMGKFKTAIADVGMGLLFLREQEFAGLPAHNIGMLCLWSALVLAIYSAVLYTRSFFEKAKFSTGPSR